MQNNSKINTTLLILIFLALVVISVIMFKDTRNDESRQKSQEKVSNSNLLEFRDSQTGISFSYDSKYGMATSQLISGAGITGSALRGKFTDSDITFGTNSKNFSAGRGTEILDSQECIPSSESTCENIILKNGRVGVLESGIAVCEDICHIDKGDYVLHVKTSNSNFPWIVFYTKNKDALVNFAHSLELK